MDLGNLEDIQRLVLLLKDLGVQSFSMGEFTVVFPAKAAPSTYEIPYGMFPEEEDQQPSGSTVDWVADGIRV